MVLAGLALAGLALTGPARAVEPEPPAPSPDAGAVVLRLKTVAPKASPWGELLTNVATRTKKVTHGQVAVKVQWEQKSEAALVRQCQSGKTDGIAVSVGALAAAVPELDALELPFLFADYAAADRGLAAATPLVAELLAAHGFVYVMRGENGFRHFASKKGFIVKPDDLVGVTMRSQPSALHKAMWTALGATPKELQVADVPDSLEHDVVQGYDNTLLFARLATWSDHIGYVTLSSHIYQGALVVWCKPWFDKLAPELQAVMARPDPRAPSKATVADPKLEESGLKLVRVFNDKLMPEQYKALGKQLRTLTAEERAAFVAKLGAVTADFVAKTSDEGKRLVEILQRAAR
ncbi:MAG: TRAP transporter substrate-binding protein [Myxococcota bacterium]